MTNKVSSHTRITNPGSGNIFQGANVDESSKEAVGRCQRLQEDPSFEKWARQGQGKSLGRVRRARLAGRWQVGVDNGCWWTVAGRKNPAPAKKEGAGPRTEKGRHKRGEGKGGMDEMGMGMLKWIVRHFDNFAGAGKLRCTIP